MATVSPDAYATTKAVCVAAGYVFARRPMDMSLLTRVEVWLLVLVSLANTPVYARLVASADPSTALPLVAALANLLRLVWVSVLTPVDAAAIFTSRRITGLFCIGIGTSLVS